MSRWTIEQLKKMDGYEFAVALINEGLTALKRTQAIVIELPEGMTRQEREDLANAIHDYRIEASEEDRTVGIYAMPGRELEILSKLEEALRI